MCAPPRRHPRRWAKVSPTHSALAASERLIMTTTGTGIFYDGLTSARHEVAVELDGDAVRVSASDGAILAQWRFADISPLATPAGGRRGRLADPNAAGRPQIPQPAPPGA